MKFKVFLQYIKMFYAKVVCEKCGSRVQHKQCLRNNCEGI